MPAPVHATRRYLSPAQVARALGVSESTVKRWVDTRRLAACRTAGGHRRILAEEVVELVRRENLSLDLTALRAELPRAPASARELADRLQAALQAGDAGEVRSLIFDAGLPVARLADEVISPVMARIGHGWEVGDLDVYHEHRATLLCHAALSSLEVRMSAASPASHGRPLALGGGPEGDHYLLANLLVGMALREAGWRVVNLGPNTPFRSLRRAVLDLRPRLVWLSCSHLANPEAFLCEYGEFYRDAERAGVAVAVGGRALGEPIRRRMTFTHFGDRIGHLAAFAGAF